MTSQQTPSDLPREDEFPLYDPTPSGPGAPVDNPAPDSPVVREDTAPTVGARPPSSGRRNLLALAGVGAVGVVGLGWLSRPERADRSGALSLPDGVKNYEVDATSGRVSLRGTDGAAAGKWSGGRNAPQINQSGDTATVEARTGSDLELTVPTGASVRIRVTSGDVRVDGVGLEALTIRATSGDIRIEDSAAAALTAETTSGDVDLRLTTSPESVSVSTTSGDVEITLPGRGYRYSTDTRSGDVTVPDSTGGAQVDIRTTSGDIEVEQD